METKLVLAAVVVVAILVLLYRMRGCRTDANCADGQACVDRKCVPVLRPRACQSAAGCPPGQMCKLSGSAAGVCVDDPQFAAMMAADCSQWQQSPGKKGMPQACTGQLWHAAGCDTYRRGVARPAADTWADAAAQAKSWSAYKAGDKDKDGKQLCLNCHSEPAGCPV